MNPPPEYDGTNRSWSELNRWAMCRHPGWQNALHTAERMGLPEVEELRLLAHTLLVENVAAHNDAIESMGRTANPYLFIPTNALNPLPEHLREAAKDPLDNDR